MTQKAEKMTLWGGGAIGSGGGGTNRRLTPSRELGSRVPPTILEMLGGKGCMVTLDGSKGLREALKP